MVDFLFDDIFSVEELNPNKEKFDKGTLFMVERERERERFGVFSI